MGVTELFAYIRKRLKKKKVNITSVLKENDLIVVDGNSILYSLCKKEFDWVRGGDYRGFKSDLLVFLDVLSRYDVVWVFDGKLEDDKRDEKIKRYQGIVKEMRVVVASVEEGTFDENIERPCLPMGMKFVLLDTLRERNCVVKYAEGDADQLIASYDGVKAVLTADSDFFIFTRDENHDGVPIIISNGVHDFSLNRNGDVMAKVYTRDEVLELFNIEPRYLPLLGTLVGCDFFDHPLEEFLESIEVDEQSFTFKTRNETQTKALSKISKILTFLRNQEGNVEDVVNGNSNLLKDSKDILLCVERFKIIQKDITEKDLLLCVHKNLLDIAYNQHVIDYERADCGKSVPLLLPLKQILYELVNFHYPIESVKVEYVRHTGDIVLDTYDIKTINLNDNNRFEFLLEQLFEDEEKDFFLELGQDNQFTFFFIICKYLIHHNLTDEKVIQAFIRTWVGIILEEKRSAPVTTPLLEISELFQSCAYDLTLIVHLLQLNFGNRGYDKIFDGGLLSHYYDLEEISEPDSYLLIWNYFQTNNAGGLKTVEHVPYDGSVCYICKDMHSDVCKFLDLCEDYNNGQCNYGETCVYHHICRECGETTHGEKKHTPCNYYNNWGCTAEICHYGHFCSRCGETTHGEKKHTPCDYYNNRGCTAEICHFGHFCSRCGFEETTHGEKVHTYRGGRNQNNRGKNRGRSNQNNRGNKRGGSNRGNKRGGSNW